MLPNPALSVELENIGGTGPIAKGARAAEATIQLSQLIELGGKRASAFALLALSENSQAGTMKLNVWKW